MESAAVLWTIALGLCTVGLVLRGCLRWNLAARCGGGRDRTDGQPALRGDETADPVPRASASRVLS